MNQPVKAKSKRDDMPETSKWIDRRRTEFGTPYVNDCVRRAMAGEPGLFYAMEAGHVLGTPWPSDTQWAEWQRYAIVTGTKFAAFLRPPETIEGEKDDGAH